MRGQKVYKAVFLDRDGVINDDTGHYYIFKPGDFKLNRGIIEGLQLLQENGFKLVVVTNQGGVAKGIYSEQDMQKVHEKLLSLLADAGIHIEKIYHCPHHESVSSCDCRKPLPGMILQAITELHLNPSESYLIGDSIRDIMAGESAGLKSCFLIKKNSSILPACTQIVTHE